MRFTPTLKYICGTFLLEAALMVIPLVLSLAEKSEDTYCFVLSIFILLFAGLPSVFIKTNVKDLFAKEGFAIVGFSWIGLSFFGALPFFFSGDFGGFMNSFFESISGFTTTGATVISDIESLSRPILLWRSMTLWIGGMGVLAFTIALLPKARGTMASIMRAETPGLTHSRLVPKLADSSKITYLIYGGMTVGLIVISLIAGLDFFDSLNFSLSIAGTGGFSTHSASVAFYNSPLIDTVLAIATMAFGVNFSIYYCIFRKDYEAVKNNDEFKAYFIIIGASAFLIALNLCMEGLYSVLDSLRHGFFQVISIITTTGLTTANVDDWPGFSKIILFVLMFVGGSSGSTAGGLKVIRLLLSFKIIYYEISKILHPRVITSIKINAKPVSDTVIRSLSTYFLLYMFIYIGAVLLVSIDGFSFELSFSAVSSALNNVGIAFDMGSVSGSFANFSFFSKLVLSVCMLIGRLEIFPILIIFSPEFWKRVNI